MNEPHDRLAELRKQLLRGAVIPAHPLALTADRKLDERHQVALSRYYVAAGAGGVAVAVHTTQFAIREPQFGLLRPVLQLAADVVRTSDRPLISIAGVCGELRQALSEAELARSIGYQAALVSLGGLHSLTNEQLVDHCRRIAEVMPVVGFYLQPDVGGRVLDYRFWRAFLEIEQVVAIKVAPFNRYRTVDVLRAVADSGREHEVALYTGNDDNIINDLLLAVDIGGRTLRFAGGLLGHWAVWTRRAVELFEQLRRCHAQGGRGAYDLGRHAAAVTDANAVLFDAANRFAGCIPGIHAVLARQGLLRGPWCLHPDEQLSPGQAAEIDRIYREYPHLNDDEFVQENLDQWLN